MRLCGRCLEKSHRGARLKLSDKWVMEANIMISLKRELTGDDRQDKNERKFEDEGK